MCYEESISTLNFAMRAKRITQVVSRNEVIDPDKALILKYEELIQDMQTKIQVMQVEVSQSTIFKSYVFLSHIYIYYIYELEFR